MNYYLPIADLFNYPDTGLQNAIIACKKDLSQKHPACNEMILDFEKHYNKYDNGELQEYYSKTFDVAALCCLDLGYVIFGEDYKRGEFLVHMKSEQRKAGQVSQIELADYLPNVLRLLNFHGDKEFVEQLAYCITIPAMKEIINEFRSPDNIYKKLLQMTLNVLIEDFKHCDMEQIDISTEKDKNVMCRTCKT